VVILYNLFTNLDCSFKYLNFFFFSSRRRHTRSDRDWSSDVCSSDLRFVQLDEKGAKEIAKDPAGYKASLEASLAVLRRVDWTPRSEERRVGKECRARWSVDH